MSSTANARRSAPAQPALTAGETHWVTSARPSASDASHGLSAVGPLPAGMRQGLSAASTLPTDASQGLSAASTLPAGTRHGLSAVSTLPADAGHGLSAARTLPAGKSRARTPRPWAAALQRPAAKILVAGGLTLAGWLLTGALSGSTATAAETASCPEAPAVSTVDHSAKPSFAHSRHHRSHREAAPSCARQADETETPSSDTETAAKQSTKDTQTEEPATKATSSQGLLGGLVHSVTSATKPLTQPTTKATSSGDLLGGLVGGVLNVVGGTLNTVTTTVDGTLNTVSTLTNTLSHTVLAPLTQPSAGNPDAPVLLPLDDILDPILGGSSNSGGVTTTVTGIVGDVLTPVTTTATTAAAETAPAAADATTSPASRVAVVHLVEVQNTLPAQQEQPRDSGVHATGGGGGDSTPGLPGGTSAPSAPAPTAAPGHDGPGGVRHPFAVHADNATTTQLKLIGTSLDHEVDGAGREAALPTTSPD
ncbi:hypothetical protein Amsp01_070280 [Amycolatopsis sp. NBRC 101858]|uniref:hypothetical protein n=1 Tax=Amycolatopsis sp. NBRC 101858 TaxID=3032200 RepID=UPI0024A5171A|nr:hypothetical protein [Amycolatopsis sp. NBRC 101858]GLY41005.1 hypothetical protein Amsp01_070280 [Amycolatopsis sp. NBRC 101858]